MVSLDLDCWAVCLAKHERRQLVCDSVLGIIPRTMFLVPRIIGQCDTRFTLPDTLITKDPKSLVSALPFGIPTKHSFGRKGITPLKKNCR